MGLDFVLYYENGQILLLDGILMDIVVDNAIDLIFIIFYHCQW